MSDTKDFSAGVNSDVRKTPVRVAFVTRRTSAQVKAYDEPKMQTFPEVLFRAAVAVEILAIILIVISLFFNAPLEGLADPTHTPNPAKAPWYFLGLQELLHYFPPVVAGVLVPTLVVLALIVIPYFNINVEAEGLFTKDRKRRLKFFWAVGGGFFLFLIIFDVIQCFKNWVEAREFAIVAIAPTAIMLGLMTLTAYSPSDSPSKFRKKLVAKPLSYWIMTWFLFELVLLTAVGTLFRGPGWSWVWPWSGGVQ
jgi:quinol-cytochrome oxidoreductase complex cytochrome b subunit